MAADLGPNVSAAAAAACGTSEIRPPKTVQKRAIKETKPLGMALVLSKVNMRSVDPILPLKIQNSNTFNGFLPLLGAFVLCSDGPRAACSPAATRRPRHAPVVAIANTHHERHFATQQPHRPESERPQQPPPWACGRRAVRAAVCGVGRSCAHTNTQIAPPRWL